jgi:endonuclease/exonuclease/phosphatase family metal-dependent hydrolase
MKLVTYNIQYTKGRDDRFDLPRVVASLRGADVVGLQEVDRFWRRTGLQDQAAAIAERMPGFHWVFAAGYDVAPSLPDLDNATAAERGRRRQHGNMLLSRWPILSSRILRLPRGAPRVWSQDRVMIEAVINAAGGPLRVYVTHMCHISSETRVPQAQAIRDWLRVLPTEGACWSGDHPEGDYWTDGDPAPPYPEAAVLMGDLNFEADGPEYRLLAGGDDAPLRDTLRCLDRDPLDPVEHTFKGLRPPHPVKRIDHVLVTPDLAGRVRAVRVDQQAEGSDHYPVWVELNDAA